MVDFIDVLASEMSREDNRYHFVAHDMRLAMARYCLKLVPDPTAQLATQSELVGKIERLEEKACRI